MSTHGWKCKQTMKLVTAIMMCVTFSGCQTGGVGANHQFLTMFRHSSESPAVTHEVFNAGIPATMATAPVQHTACEATQIENCATR